MKRFDAVMIGFGKGAKTLAAELAARGEKVAVIEQSDKMYGGTCINVGCIPTKSLVNSAAEAKRLSSFAEKRTHYARAVEEKNRLTAMLRAKNYAKIADAPNAEVITGHAEFTSPRTLLVREKDGQQELYGEKIFINTGSNAFLPPIEGIHSSRVYTSETLMDVTELPEKLAIVGGGYIGLEYASMYANFGSQVTVLQVESEFIPREDREIAAEIFKVLSEKIDFRLGAQIRSIREIGNKTWLEWLENGEMRALDADAILIATGRRPATADLHLEKAGVETLPNGAVRTDAHLKTTADHIWAMGDCKGGLQFTYISLDDARIVRAQLFGGDRTAENRGAIPYSVFIDPPFSHVGLNETQAKAAGKEVLAARLAVAAIPKAHVLKSPRGLMKAVVEKQSGRILGADLFCEESHELVNLIKFAIDAGLPYTVLRDAIYTHPTMSESFNDLFANLK